jgi:dihydropyrimidine dehydrogenase (NAD+) subunit PreA
MKLGVDEFDYVAVAKAGKNSGAAMISGPNALPGIAAPDIHGFKLTYPGVEKQGLRGAYSGPAMNPVGLNFTLICAKVIQLPVISGGGVMTWQHAVERIALGASGISIVSAVYLKGVGAIKECLDGLKSYLTKNNIDSVDDLRGVALKNYTDVDASEAETDEAQCIDLENSWPDRLQNYWWSS